MAKLYFRYGAMGSSKTANALMVEYNYYERGKRALLVKPQLENRDGELTIKSRMGLSKECGLVEELVKMKDAELLKYDCIIVDEAQFITKEQVRFLVHIVDDLELPVICYGLRTDFRHELFEGSKWLLAWADSIEELKTVCWCGKGASCNARISNGKVVYDGEQVVLGGNESYMALCRKHYYEGNLGETFEVKK
ncbi:MAG: thymidine kinase [Acetatifactor sp.]|nr:thymidine kinase [Acetatifactor sp.]